MEEPRSVNSPRRILSFSKRRRTATASVSFVDPNERTNSGFGVSGKHGPKLSEVYGFVGSITTVVATAIFLVWAYIPEPWLHSVGIFYYPSRYWALAVPTYAMVIIVLAIGFYIGLNFISTPPPTSLTTIFGKFQIAFLLMCSWIFIKVVNIYKCLSAKAKIIFFSQNALFCRLNPF
ncbi:hypothetical protein DITRI_Ditri13aG0156900 [Diplodiscus trichospermus]